MEPHSGSAVKPPTHTTSTQNRPHRASMEPHSGSAVKPGSGADQGEVADGCFNGAALWERGETTSSARINHCLRLASMEPHSGSAVKHSEPAIHPRKPPASMEPHSGSAVKRQTDYGAGKLRMLQWSRTLGAR